MQQIQFTGVDPLDFIKEITEAIEVKANKRFEDFKKNFEPKKPTEYIGRHKVAELLDVTIGTVHNMTLKGILTRYQLGGRKILYKRHEVEAAIVKLDK